MLFYGIINKRTRDKTEINKIFFSGVDAKIFSDSLNKQFGLHNCYIPYPFLHIPTDEEKEIYEGVIKRRRIKIKKNEENEKLN